MGQKGGDGHRGPTWHLSYPVCSCPGPFLVGVSQVPSFKVDSKGTGEREEGQVPFPAHTGSSPYIR